jgi:hypothetical protein
VTLRQAALSALTLLCFVGAQPGAVHAQQSGWADAPQQTGPALGEGWRSCAQEGGVCQVSGRAVVRYGVPGRWATRSVNGSVTCSNDAFGDPAPGTPKRCEVAGYGDGGSSDWVFCAPEGETCRFRGSADVRFGHGGRYTTRHAYGSVPCDVRSFGDPYYGVTKHCEVRRDAALGGSGGYGQGGSWGGGNDSWRYCAGEGQVCRVNGSAQVRFGDGQRFSTRTVNGSVDCSTRVFGDPIYGKVKHCEVQSAAWTGGGGYGAGSAGGTGWSLCANEGGYCSFDGRAQVRYGTHDRYYYRDAWGGVSCSNESFGGDPYYNKPKRCEIQR